MAYRAVTSAGDLRYLRRVGNRRVRARRRRRTALRLGITALLWILGAAGAAAGAATAYRWAISPARFQLRHVEITGADEAAASGIRDLMSSSMGGNILTLDLAEMEKRVREHPWIGPTGSVRISRRLPAGLSIAVRLRTASGKARDGGVVVLLDERGLPIEAIDEDDAGYPFPIILGSDGRPERLSRGVEVTRLLAEREPGLYERIKEIDLSEESMVILGIEGEPYDLRLSPEDVTKNLDEYFSIRAEIIAGDEPIEYVDLRWDDRIAVMPAAELEEDGGE